MSNYTWGRPATVFTILILVAVMVPLAGCGSGGPTGTVEGNVTFAGQPYSNAEVIFFNVDTGQGSSSSIQADGSYEISTPIPVGSYVVYLAPKVDTADPAGAEGGTMEGAEGPMSMTGDEDVPGKYWNEAESDIKVEIKKGLNEVPVDLSE